MVFTSDVLTNAGYIKPKDLELSSTDSLTDYGKVAARVSFQEYFTDLLSPYFQERYPGLDEEGLIQHLEMSARCARTSSLQLLPESQQTSTCLSPEELLQAHQLHQ